VSCRRNVAAGSSCEEPAAREPGPGGWGEVTGIAESSCYGDVGCPMLAETTSRLYCAIKC
jgi:hypothetical protein